MIFMRGSPSWQGRAHSEFFTRTWFVRVVRDAVLQALLITFSTETSRPQSSKTAPNERYLMDSIMSDPEKLMTTNKK